MRTKFRLLPHWCQIVGYAYLTGFLVCTVYALISSSSFHRFVLQHWHYVGILNFVMIFLAIFSKEKVEDEMTISIRVNALTYLVFFLFLASLTVSIGAMAIVGSIEDGIHGNPSILISKAILDFMIILLMAASMGKGCVFSFVPVGILQGSVTLLAIGLRGIFTEPALAGLSLTGNVIISLNGVNLLFGKTIKTANLLPALVLSILLTFLLGPGV